MRSTVIAALVFAACCCIAAGQTTRPDALHEAASTPADTRPPLERGDLKDMRAITTYTHGTMTPVDLPDGSRATLSIVSTGVWNPVYRVTWRYLRRFSSGACDTSTIIFEKSTMPLVGQEPNEYDKAEWYLTQGYSSGYRVMVCVNLLHELFSAGVTVTGSVRLFLMYDFAAKHLDTLVAPDWSGEWDLPIGAISIERAKEYGLPLMAVSEPADSVVLHFCREQYRTEQQGAHDPHFHRRSVQAFTLNGDAASAAVLLDSIPGASTSISDRIVPGYTKDFYIVHCTAPGDTIVAERFRRDGRKLSTLVTGIVPSTAPVITSQSFPYSEYRTTLDTMSQLRIASYEVRRISGERFALTFTPPAGGSKVRSCTALFDKNFLPLGPPQPSSKDPDGELDNPSLLGRAIDAPALSDDNASEDATARIGSDAVNRLCAKSTRETVADALEISPNPCRGSTCLRRTTRPVAGLQESIGIFDALGRCIRIIAPEQLASSSDALHLDLAGLPAGIYHVALFGGPVVLRKNLIVLR